MSFRVVADSPLLDARHVEDVPNEHVELADGCVDAVKFFLVFIIHILRRKHADIPADDRERGFELVGGHGNKVVFHLVRVLEALIESGIVNNACMPQKQEEHRKQHKKKRGIRSLDVFCGNAVDARHGNIGEHETFDVLARAHNRAHRPPMALAVNVLLKNKRVVRLEAGRAIAEIILRRNQRILLALVN